jgi:branched-chain amino acid transport system permease protein
MAELVIHILNGISYGMILFLLASGLSFTIGIMGILNLTHGSLYMIGAYVGLSMVGMGGDFWFAALVGGVITALIGLILERTFFRFLYKQINEQVLLTLGFVYIFSNLVLWIWGPFPKIAAAPSYLVQSIVIGNFSFPVYRFALIVIGLIIGAGMWWFQEKTKIGAIVRAGMDDKEMTMGLGINYGVIASSTLCLGAFLGGLAGFLGAPILGAQSDMGFPILLLTLVVIVVGGEGSVQGALVGALLVGIIDAFGRAFFPDFAMFTVYAILIAFLLVKPTGLFGRR